MKKLIPIYAVLTALVMFVVQSCNVSSEEEENQSYNMVSSNTLVTGFSLAKNDSVMALLDSVRFTVDVNRRLIYNADSLPLGTKIDRLITRVSLASSTSTSEFEISGATNMKDTTFAYGGSENTDSIDFTGDVYLTVKAADGISSKRYKVVVNVHKMNSDSLYWNEMERTELPGGVSNPVAQKTVQCGGALFTLVQGASGYVVSTCENPEMFANWQKTTVNFGFIPVVSSLIATDDALYILSTEGALYKSTDGGQQWSATGKTMYSLVSGYGNTLLGVEKKDGKYYYAYYPSAPAGADAGEVDKEFPVSGTSQSVIFANDWSQSKQALVLGGQMADGGLTGNVWGFDGKVWAKLSNVGVPAARDITLVSYYYYMNRTGTLHYDKYPVWFAFGGKLADGSLSKKVYLSFDNGLHWSLGNDLVQLPESMDAFYGAQAYVYTSLLTTRMASGWEPVAVRQVPVWMRGSAAQTRVSTPVNEWECPYIYVFGGYEANGALSNTIWRGVVNRLSFKPII